MVHYIYGPPGYGKTHTVLNYIKSDVQAGKKVFLIVPEQESVAVERRVLTLIPGEASLGVEVMNFSRLCDKIFRTFGGLSYNLATKPLKSLVMWDTLRELSPMLEEYGSERFSDLSLVKIMLSAVTELKAYCVSPALLEATSAKIEQDSPLYARLRDISLIYSAYTAQLGEHFSDSADDITRALEILRGKRFFSDCSVYVDSFSGFTSQEMLFLERIGNECDDLYITLPVSGPNDFSIHTDSVRRTAKELRSRLGERADEIFLTENHRTASPSLAYLTDNLWKFDAPPLKEESDDVKIIVCDTPYSEADAAAAEICALVRDGAKYGDIAIILRDAEKYRGILDSALSKYRIPYFFSEKTDFMTKPLVKLLFGALKIRDNNWRGADVISYVKSGFCGVDPYMADIFEEYVVTWNIHGSAFFEESWSMNPDGYAGELTARGRHILVCANEIKNSVVPTLSAYFTRLDAAKNVREMCEATVRFFKDCSVTEHVRENCARSLELGDRKAADEDRRLYSLTLSILYDLSSVLGEKSVTPREFEDALSVMFSESDIGTIPTSADEVTVGSASMLRTGNVRHAIVMGLNEGEFPASVKDNGVFGDGDKEILSQFNIKLSSDTSVRTSEELFFAHRALCAPSETLTLTCSELSSDGSSQARSVILSRVRALLPCVTPLNDSLVPKTEKIYTSQLLRESYPALAGLRGSDKLRALVLSEEGGAEFLDRLSTPLSVRECKISPDITARLFGSRLGLTQSRLEKYVGCAFDYYCSYVLGLRESKRATLKLNNMGTFIHYILEDFMREITNGDVLNFSLSDEEIEKILEKSVEKSLIRLLGEDYAISNRTRHLFLRLHRLSLLISKNLLDEFKQSDFIPSYFELKIGYGDGGMRAIEFTLADGSTVSVHGIVDRVDTYKKDGDVYIRVVDYKTGSKEFSFSDLKEGLNTQLLIYLFSLCYAQPEDKKRELGASEGGEIIPAGIQYLSSNAPSVSVESYCDDETLERLISDKFKRSGILTSDPEILRAMNHNLDKKIVSKTTEGEDGTLTGKSLASREQFAQIYEMLESTVKDVAESIRGGVADAIPIRGGDKSPCRYCKMKAVCRSGAANKAGGKNE